MVNIYSVVSLLFFCGVEGRPAPKRRSHPSGTAWPTGKAEARGIGGVGAVGPQFEARGGGDFLRRGFRSTWIYGCGSKVKSQGYAGFRLWFHSPRCHFGYLFLSHSHIYIYIYMVSGSGFPAPALFHILNELNHQPKPPLNQPKRTAPPKLKRLTAGPWQLTTGSSGFSGLKFGLGWTLGALS